MKEDFTMLNTEMRNMKSLHIDKMDTVTMLKLINEENKNAAASVEYAIKDIAKAVDAISQTLENGGRLFYIGAGTSGRLAVLDAAECPPTFGVSETMVTAVIAGGVKSMMHASEDAEDSAENGAADLMNCKITKRDIVVGISASGGAEYVIGALKKAREVGCKTISLCSNANTPIDKLSDISIYTDTGAEVITGSTRMKAGTAQKLVLNMLSTSAMIKLGYVHENLMINLQPVNKKIRKRMVYIICELTGSTEERAMVLLNKHNWEIKKVLEYAMHMQKN